MAIANDIVRKQGDTYPIEVTILRESGAPLDLTGATDLKLGVASSEIVVQPDVPDLLLVGVLEDASSGKAKFSLSTPEAESLAAGDYFSEIQFTQNGFIITTETFRYRVKGQIVK